MPETEPNSAIYYNSEYLHGVDEKRRLQIPSKWRPEVGECGFTLVPWPNGGVKEACLMALPRELWIGLVDKVRQMPFSDPKADSLRRLIGRKSDTVVLDRSGRICLPEGMARVAGIDKQAKLIGLLDRFQIWNPERLAAVSLVDESLSNEAFQLI